MNRILKSIGWAAVAVDGFIPPGAFMEFTKYNVLVIAADIRTLEHIEYTPAPDIIHESAGHAPILAMPEFADYLKAIGDAGSKAFSSKKDVELYEAIRHLSIIKEDPNTRADEVLEAEAAIEKVQQNMGEPSEMALIRNLHWWTVEYGLIGTVDNFKLYGAGLLSSIGEGMSCLTKDVKKMPYTIDAMHYNYDITKPQPQLFVTPDFAHLTTVLEQFKKLMAWTTGGLDGIENAIASQQTATIVYSSGLQVTSTFTNCLETAREPILVQTEGPTSFSLNNSQLHRYGKERFNGGITAPVGKLLDTPKPLEEFSDEDLSRMGIERNRTVQLRFKHGIEVEGQLREIVRSREGKIIILELHQASVRHNGEVILVDPDYAMPVGECIVSAFAGPADVEAFQPTVIVPHEKMHKITYDQQDLELHELYRKVREARTNPSLRNQMETVLNKVVQDFPDDWLLSLEILEILDKVSGYEQISSSIRDYLNRLKKRKPEVENLISNGLKLIHLTENQVLNRT